MNHRLIDALMSAVAPVVRDYFSKAVEPVMERLTAIEAREPIKGEPGLDGKDGAPGRDGVDGKDGAAGEPGPQGEKGEPGLDGKDGAPGERGLQGAKGDPGDRGTDGVAGRDGQPGVPGRDGKDGAHGRDGLDGLGIDNLELDYDGERTFTFKWSAGERIVTKSFAMPITIYRGVWKEGQFTRGDEVTFGGSQFIAKRDTARKPETSDDWQLACKRGRDGRDGKNGARGLQGLKGDRGEQGPRGFGV